MRTVIVEGEVQTMRTTIVVVAGALLVAGCVGETTDSREQERGSLARVDSCDLRALFGTCREYELSELDDWYREYVESACPSNRRGDLVGVYRKETRCPTEGRVARCEGMIEDPAERYEYDKHYYAGTADGYDWEASNVRVTCEGVSGHFVPD